jgi:hypothetical protein
MCLRGHMTSVDTGTRFPAMVTVAEFAGALRFAERTIQRKCAESQIPGAIKVFGDKWLIPASTIAALLGGEEKENG